MAPCDAEVYDRLREVELKQALDAKDIVTLQKELPLMERRIGMRLDAIDAWAGRIFWALAVGAVGIIMSLGAFWVKNVRSEAPPPAAVRSAERE